MNERDELDYIFDIGLGSGLGYFDILKLNPRKMGIVYRGYLKRQEDFINSMIFVGHLTAGKMGQAFAGSDEFKKPINDIKLVGGDVEVQEWVDMCKGHKIDKSIIRDSILRG